MALDELPEPVEPDGEALPDAALAGVDAPPDETRLEAIEPVVDS